VAKRVLVVEDSILISSALRILLEANGYDVVVAGTANDAVEAASTSPPDVMLLDLTLPDGDGLSVLGDLKARHAKPLVTLAMTGHDDDITRKRCMAAGCTEVLLKPVPINDLLRIIGEQVT
jgi:two-component system, OmpR family, KDP operon response regulator KdpE